MATRRQDSGPRAAEPFRAHGEIDMATANAFRGQVYRYAATTQGDVVLDFTDLDFIDSSGIAALFGIARVLAGHDRRLIVTNPSPMTQRVFEVCGLQDAFTGTATDPEPFSAPLHPTRPHLRLA